MHSEMNPTMLGASTNSAHQRPPRRIHSPGPRTTSVRRQPCPRSPPHAAARLRPLGQEHVLLGQPLDLRKLGRVVGQLPEAPCQRADGPCHLRMPGFARRPASLGRAPLMRSARCTSPRVSVLSFGRRSGGSRSGGSCAGATCPGFASEPSPSSLPVSPSPAPSRALSYGAGEWDGRTAQRPLPTAAPARHRQLASSDGDASH